MTGFAMILVLAVASVLAFWRLNPVLFLVTAGIAIMVGLNTPDLLSGNTSTDLGRSVGLMIIMYALAMVAFAYVTLFRLGDGDRDGDSE